MKYIKTYENLGFELSKPSSKSVNFDGIECVLSPDKILPNKRILVYPFNEEDSNVEYADGIGERRAFRSRWKREKMESLKKSFDKKGIKYTTDNGSSDFGPMLLIVEDMSNILNTYYKTFYEE